MATIAPINLIEIVDGAFRKKAQIAGSGITVAEIVSMHLRNGLSVEWLTENYALSPAQIYAALAYYYMHQDEIDEAIRESDRLIEENATPFSEIIERTRRRQSR